MSTALHRYYCHKCARDTIPCPNTLTCPVCNDGFIEEMPSAVPQRASSVYLGTLRRSSRRSSGEDHSRMSRDSSIGSSMETDSNASMTEMLLNMEGDHMYTRPVSLDYMLQQLLENILGPDRFSIMNILRNGNESSPMGQGEFDRIITQMLNRLDNGGLPPATQEELNSLNSIKITQTEVESQATCSICFEEYVLQENVIKLPCVHLFHHDCILEWLRRHGTCPVCRKTLSGDDTTKESHEIQANSVRSDAPSSSNEPSNALHLPEYPLPFGRHRFWRRQPRNERGHRGSPSP